MPKLKVEGPLVRLKNFETGETLAEVVLPMMCLMHMKTGDGSTNLALMKKHLKLQENVILYTEDQTKMDDLDWKQCAQGLELRIYLN